ncbi:flavin reductase family protein [Caulobacter sp. LARHSG274]
MAAEASDFREGMRRLASSVTILTAQPPGGERAGMTATAVCSVTADPPTLLCCINRNSASRSTFLKAASFAVNVLASTERELADRFARPMDPALRFEAGAWTTLHSGAPILETAAAAFDCSLAKSIDVGGHTIFFGEVQAVRVRGSSIMPLLYAHGGYGRFAGRDPGPLLEALGASDWLME